MPNGPTVGKMDVNREHDVDPDVLVHAIEAFEAAAARFSIYSIADARVRENYMINIRRMSKEIGSLVDSKQITVKEGAEFCNKMRNSILLESRSVTSPHGLAVAVKKKPHGMPLHEALDKYAQKVHKSSFSSLSEQRKNRIFYEIVQSSARDNEAITVANKRLKVIGKVGLLVTGVLATHAIIYAENRPKEMVKQGLGIGGGIFGGFLAGLAVSSICGPGAPFCAVAVVLAGSIAGGVAGGQVADTLDDELEEFSRWNIA